MGIAELPITIGRPAALGASTLCEAFQITAAERPDQVALRSFGSGTAITFAEYAQRVRAIAAGLHALGVRRGDTVGIMLVNRPEFHLVDMAAIHLGDHAVLDLQHVFPRAGRVPAPWPPCCRPPRADV